MSKPLTKGLMIGVRLPLDADAVIRQRAADRGLSPGLYIADVITRAANVRAPDRGQPIARQEVGPPPAVNYSSSQDIRESEGRA